MSVNGNGTNTSAVVTANVAATVWPTVRNVAMAGARRVGELTARQLWQSMASVEPPPGAAPQAPQQSDSDSEESDLDDCELDESFLEEDTKHDDSADEKWPSIENVVDPTDVPEEPPSYANDSETAPEPMVEDVLGSLFMPRPVLGRAELNAQVNMPTSFTMPVEVDMNMVRENLVQIYSSQYDFSSAARKERERFLGTCDRSVAKLQAQINAKLAKKARYLAIQQLDSSVDSLGRLDREYGNTVKRQRRS